MNRLTLCIAATLHAVYVLAWWSFGSENELVFERWSVTIAVTVITLSSLSFFLAYWWSRKSLLNTAMATYKFYMFVGFGLIFVPSVWGGLINDAPYRVPANPYTFWSAPPILRTYLYDAIAVTSLWVLFEFLKVNWDPLTQLINRRLEPRDEATAALERTAAAMERQADATEKIAEDVGRA